MMKYTQPGDQRSGRQSPESMTTQDESWLDREISRSEFQDIRLKKRYRILLEKLWQGLGGSIPFACQDWANTKAAYRFFSNDRVNEHDILRGHFEATRTRLSATEGPVLVLHDTTEFSYQREQPALIGAIGTVPCSKPVHIKPDRQTVCGILMHSSLAVTLEGLPLGLAAVKFWTRRRFKGCNALKKRVNPTRVPIEEKESFRWLQNMQQSTHLLDDPRRCIHIGDRESDIYELFCLAQTLQTHFLVRTCANRLAGQGHHTVADEMRAASVQGFYSIHVRDKRGRVSHVRLALKYRRIHVLPSISKQNRYPAHDLTVLCAQEQAQPSHRKRIDWKLITHLPVTSRREAIEKLDWYAMRWKIETFHKILKSGCRVEESKLRTADRLVNLIAIFCLLSWRLFWITMLNRAMPNAPVQLVLTPVEMDWLNQQVRGQRTQLDSTQPLSSYLIVIAQLGGYLARRCDPPPGHTVMWRGLQRLTQLQLGFHFSFPIYG